MRTPLRTSRYFALLCASSVAMTLGNKWLARADGALAAHAQLVVFVQNAIAVAVLGCLASAGAVRVSPLDRTQLGFYTWDALVLVVQLWTSLGALRHLPVSATSVVRALAVPCVAWLELAVLGARLRMSRHVAAWAVAAGAAMYAYADLATPSDARSGYLWAAANLAAYCSNSVLDRHFMSRSAQTAGGLALYTQLISLPISLCHIVLIDGTRAADFMALARALDPPTAAALLVTGVLAALLGSMYAACYRRASATAVTFMGNVNKAASIAGGAIVFGGALSAAQCIGLLATLGGAFAFAWLGAADEPKAAKLKGA